jgi:hypothetical protein
MKRAAGSGSLRYNVVQCRDSPALLKTQISLISRAKIRPSQGANYRLVLQLLQLSCFSETSGFAAQDAKALFISIVTTARCKSLCAEESSVGKATSFRLDSRHFTPRAPRAAQRPALDPSNRSCLLRVQNGLSVEAVTQNHLVARPRMRGATPPPLHLLMA